MLILSRGAMIVPRAMSVVAAGLMDVEAAVPGRIWLCDVSLDCDACCASTPADRPHAIATVTNWRMNLEAIIHRPPELKPRVVMPIERRHAVGVRYVETQTRVDSEPVARTDREGVG